ncbi:MAG: c-type cytochrome biogenesis protein CcmI, partial [Magnetovibrio sp.]|nr:c-type cytochrome biogenesis protein CcmI [Magnetovibrio sp.]
AGVDAPTRSAFDITVYKDQLNEIDRDLERGVLNDGQALAARTEIERRMLATAQDSEGEAAQKAVVAAPKMSMALLLAVLVVVPVGTVASYLYLGQPQMKDQPLAQRQLQGNSQASIDRKAEVQQMMVQIAKRLEENPKDIDAWMIQGQVYSMTNRYVEAVESYQQVVILTDRHPGALASLVETMIMAEDSIVIQSASKILKEIKAKDPSEPRSYFYLALERQQRGDLSGAMSEYLALLKVSPSDAEWVGQVEESVQALANEMSISVPVVEMLPPTGPPAGANTVPALTEEQIRGAQEMSKGDQQSLIRSMVQRLADRLKDEPDDLVGWQRLAKAYEVLGETQKAAEAQAQIERLKGQ